MSCGVHADGDGGLSGRLENLSAVACAAIRVACRAGDNSQTGVLTMHDYQLRVLKECVELTEKIVRLEEFITGAIFQPLTAFEKDTLIAQHSAMRTYEAILNIRIAGFKNDNAN